MNLNDFRYMHQGKQIADLAPKEGELLTSLNQRGAPKKRALLMLHGFASSPAAYRYLIPKLKGYDALVCPILPGHGQSIQAFSQIKGSDWLAEARRIAAELSAEYQQLDVLGLSLGGLLACELSKEFQLNHLYLLAPALKLSMGPHMLKLAKLLHYLGFSHLRNAAGNIMNLEHAEISYRKLPITTIIEMLQLVHNYQWQAPSCPTDLFLGSEDPVVNSKAVEQLFASVKTANIHWLKHSAHVLPLDNDLKEIVQCINKKT
jgi:carboxylesterase